MAGWLRGLGVRQVVVSSVRDFFRDDMATSAAALSYHLFFALFPFLVFLLALFHLLGLTAVFDWLVDRAGSAAPEGVGSLLQRVVSEVDDTGANGVLSLSILLGVWMTSTGMRSVMNALNRAYDVKDARPLGRRYLLSILYTLAFSGLVLLSVLLLVLGPKLAGLVVGAGVDEALVRAWGWVQLPVAVLLAALAILLVYRFAPCGSPPLRRVAVGTVVALALWLVISLGFRYYVDHFGTYTTLYGSLGAVIVLLLYIFLSACALLLGGEVNGVIDREPAGPRGAGADGR